MQPKLTTQASPAASPLRDLGPPEEVNIYSFVANRPIGAIDPFGDEFTNIIIGWLDAGAPSNAPATDTAANVTPATSANPATSHEPTTGQFPAVNGKTSANTGGGNRENRERMHRLGYTDAAYNDEFKRIIGPGPTYTAEDATRWLRHIEELEQQAATRARETPSLEELMARSTPGANGGGSGR